MATEIHHFLTHSDIADVWGIGFFDVSTQIYQSHFVFGSRNWQRQPLSIGFIGGDQPQRTNVRITDATAQ
jgi:hypothetical protein